MVRDVVSEAILGKRLLEFRLTDGHLRVIEPHELGESADGMELVLGWLVREDVETNERDAWRVYRIEEMTDATTLEDGFEAARPGFDAPLLRFSVSHCALEVQGGSAADRLRQDRIDVIGAEA